MNHQIFWTIKLRFPGKNVWYFIKQVKSLLLISLMKEMEMSYFSKTIDQSLEKTIEQVTEELKK